MSRQHGQKPMIYALMTSLLCMLWAFPGMAAFVVSGAITDSGGTGIPLVQVEIYDEDIGPDDLLDTTYANAAGNYSKNLTNIFFENPDVYIKVDWFAQMLPAASFDDHLIKLTAVVNAAKAVVTTFTSKESGITADHDPTIALPNKNLQMNQVQPRGLAALFNQINISLNYYETNKGTISWSVTYDVPVRVRLVNRGSFHSVGTITISDLDIPPKLPTGSVADIYHEMGHLVHYRIGNDLPPEACPSPHNRTIESTRGCSIREGWASYVGELTDAGPGVADGKYAPFRDTMNIAWRGDEGPGTGRDAGTYESGDVVEGAYGGAWFGIDGVPSVTTFTDNFKVMVEDDPDNMFEFIDEITTNKGANTAQTRGIYGALQTSGIAYGRARLESVPFNEDEPPDDAPGSEESYAKEIDGVMFLRGTEVTVELEEVPKANLGVAEKLTNDEVKIGYKTATNGDGDAASTIATFTADVNFALFDPDLELDTQAIGDGDWDLVVIGKNARGFSDNLRPTWGADAATGAPADGTAAVNTDEKYLKAIGTWYDKDRDSSTNTDKEGKVAIDNTAPTIDATQFKPQ